MTIGFKTTFVRIMILFGKYFKSQRLQKQNLLVKDLLLRISRKWNFKIYLRVYVQNEILKITESTDFLNLIIFFKIIQSN